MIACVGWASTRLLLALASRLERAALRHATTRRRVFSSELTRPRWTAYLSPTADVDRHWPHRAQRKAAAAYAKRSPPACARNATHANATQRRGDAGSDARRQRGVPPPADASSQYQPCKSKRGQPGSADSPVIQGTIEVIFRGWTGGRREPADVPRRVSHAKRRRRLLASLGPWHTLGE